MCLLSLLELPIVIKKKSSDNDSKKTLKNNEEDLQKINQVNLQEKLTRFCDF